MADVKGLAELRENFKRLGRDMETRAARLVVAAGGKVLKQAAIANARANGSVQSGVMIKNIAIKHERQGPAGTAQINLGVRHGAAGQTKKQRAANKRLKVVGRRVVVQYVNNPFYFRWVERGHKIVPRQRGEQGTTATGTVPAKPFLEPALRDNQQAVIDAMGQRLAKELQKLGLS